jgi:hypothetical protein
VIRRVAALVLLGGCSPLATGFDALGAGPLEDTFAVAPPAPPADPAPVQLAPCPAGWSEVEADPVICEPWPDGGMAVCTGDTAHFPGDPGCATVGDACAADGWPAQLPTGRSAIFVRPGSSGTGTRESPFGTLAQALASGGAGNVIALGPGTYGLDGALPANTALFGACVAQTTLSVAAGSMAPAIVYVTGPGVEVHSAKITGTAVGVGISGATAALTLQDVLIENVTGIGVLAQTKAQLTGTDVVVRGTQKRSDGTLGEAVHIVDGAVVSLTRAVISANAGAGVFVYNPGATVTLEQAAVTGNGGSGLWTNNNGVAHVTASTFDGNAVAGVHVVTASKVDLTDVVVRGSKAENNLEIDGATVTATRLRSEDCKVLGISANNASTLTLDDLVSQRDLGLGANAASQVTVHRALMRHNIGSAFTSRLTGTLIDASDVTVTDTELAPPQMTSGNAINVLRGGAMTATRMHVLRGKGVAVSVALLPSSLTLTDVFVEDTLPGSTGEAGFPLANEAAALTLERVLIQGGFTTGISVVVDGATVTLTDVDIRDIAPPASQGGLYGNGIAVTDKATVQGTRVRFTNNHDTAVLADGAGASVDLSDVSIIGTGLTCVGNPDCAMRVPVGVSSQDGAAVKLSRFLVASNTGIGVEVADTAQLDLSDGEIAFHEIGANVLPAGFDVQRLSQNVTYLHDTEKIAAQTVPLPKVPPPPPMP